MDPLFPTAKPETVHKMRYLPSSMKDILRLTLWFLFSWLQILLQPFTYLLQVQGKQIRIKLSLAFDIWLHIPPETLKVINDVVQMLHNASLL